MPKTLPVKHLLMAAIGYSLAVGFLAGRLTVSWTPDDARTEALVQEAARLDTVYVRDTLTLWRTKARWDTVLVDVDRWKTDTLRVVEYVALADSTIRACTQTVQTCEARVQAAQALTLDMQARWQASQSSQRKAALQWGLAGVGLGALLVTLRP